MITNTSSMTSSFMLRLAVTVMVTLGTLSLLISVCTNQWTKGNGRENVAYVGLWKYCSTEVCVAHSFIVYSKVLLVITTLFGGIIALMAILAQVYGVDNIKKLLAKLVWLAGFFALCGVIPATVFVAHSRYYQSVAFGLVFGWMGPFLYIVAGIVSWYHHRKEPDSDITLDDMKRLASLRNKQPPPYTAYPAPSSITVP